MKWIAYTVLAASLVLNAYLLAHRQAEVTTQSPIERDSARLLQAAERVPQPPRIIGDLRVSRPQLEQRLANAERRIEELRTPNDKWKQGDPTPEVEAKVRPYLDKVFAKVGSYKLDCRGGACRIESDVSIDVWMSDLQIGSPEAVRFQPSFADGYAYIEPREASLGSGMWLYAAILEKSKDAVVTCVTADTAHGDLGVDLDLDDASRRVSVRMSGSLANDPVGQCVRRAFEDAVAAIAVPPDAHAVLVLGQPIHFDLPVPRESAK